MKEAQPHPLTGPGKALFVITLVIFGVLLYLAFFGVFQRLPMGRYPLLYLLAPILLLTAVFFFGVGWILRKRGIATFTSEIEEVRQAFEKKKANQSLDPTRGARGSS